MVKRAISKAKLSHSFKNVLGIDITLKIEKQGQTLNIIVEPVSSLCHIKISLLLIFILYSLTYLLFNTEIAVFCTAIFISLFLCRLIRTTRQETLTMVKSLGYQITTKYAVGKRTLFIPYSEVQTVFINEVILRNKVLYVLTILTKESQGKTKLIPLFLDLKPRLQCLEIIYKHLKQVSS